MQHLMSGHKAATAAFGDFIGGAALVAGLLLLSGCGGGSSTADNPDPTQTAEEGVLYVGITDAEGDFASYTVDVLSIALERANGTTVETLPLETRVDFTELTEVTEFLSIATVPSGSYVSATIRMDFTDAQIVVQDDAGMTAEAIAVDADGAALGEFAVELQLAERDRINIAPGIPASFSLDFDLDASNTIDFDVAPATVMVEPVLIAVAELEEERRHRVRGLIDSVDTATAEIDLTVRPFFHRQGRFGEVTVLVDDETEYEVDGVGFTGAAGLEAVAALGAEAPLVADGDVDGQSIMADVVLAGTSVPWNDETVFKGVIKARSGDTLTVGGGRVEFGDGTVRFGGDLMILVGDNTEVTAPGVDPSTLSKSSLSVGQRIVAFGEVVDDQTLDSSNDRVAMRYSGFSAEVVEAQPLVASLFLLDGRRPQAFDFAGTGSAPEFDADPDNYEIDTGNLILGSITNGDLVRVRGLVAPFGAAPADFTAQTVVDIEARDRAGELKVIWPEDAPSATPFISADANGIMVDISESREFLRVRGVPRVLTNGFDMLTLTPTADGDGAYAVRVRGSESVVLFRNFDDLVDELNAELAAGSQLARIHAGVRYTGDTEQLPAARATFVFVTASDAE